MFSYFKNRREQFELMDLFEEASALSGWILITLIEDNQDFFLKEEAEYSLAKEYLDKGLDFSELGNHRVAHIHFASYINRVAEDNQNLILLNERILNGVLRLRDIEKRINPLWKKHQSKLVIK